VENWLITATTFGTSELCLRSNGPALAKQDAPPRRLALIESVECPAVKRSQQGSSPRPFPGEAWRSRPGGAPRPLQMSFSHRRLSGAADHVACLNCVLDLELAQIGLDRDELQRAMNLERSRLTPVFLKGSAHPISLLAMASSNRRRFGRGTFGFTALVDRPRGF